MIDLSLVSFDEIWEELCKRYSGLILCWVNEGEINKTEAFQLNYHGGKFTAIGLADALRHKILHDAISGVHEENV